MRLLDHLYIDLYIAKTVEIWSYQNMRGDESNNILSDYEFFLL